MKINKEKAKHCQVKERTIKQAITTIKKELDFFDLHNKNLTNKQYYKIKTVLDILYCIDTE